MGLFASAITPGDLKLRIMRVSELSFKSGEYDEALDLFHDIIDDALKIINGYIKTIEQCKKARDMHPDSDIDPKYLESLEAIKAEYEQVLDLATEYYNRLVRI